MSRREPPPEPSRAEVEKVLVDLAEGRCSREEAADWAVRWVIADDPGIEDDAVWKAIGALAGADSKVAPHTYLYFEVDFQHWLEEFRRAL